MTEVNFLVKKGLTVPKGSESTPAIIFDAGDANTGIYSPGADQLALATNGTGRLFISDDGKVGIGVSDPSSYNISADDLVIADPNGFNSGISINITDNLGSSNIWFGDSDAEGRGQLSYGHGATDRLDVLVGGNQNLALYELGGLEFLGNGSLGSPAVSLNGSAPSDSLVIDSNGKVGVGTSSPGQLLDVAGVARFGGNATKLTTYSDSTYAGIFNGSSVTSDESIYMGAGGTIFYNNGSPSVSINSSGNVGVGVTSPSSLLHLADAGNITVGTTTGTKIGTATSQKIGFYNTTPVVQPTTGVAEAAFVENSGGTAVNVDSTFGGYTIQQVVQALQTLGLLA